METRTKKNKPARACGLCEETQNYDAETPAVGTRDWELSLMSLIGKVRSLLNRL